MFSEGIDQRITNTLSNLLEQEFRYRNAKRRTNNKVEENYFIGKDDIFGSKNDSIDSNKDLLYNNSHLKQIYEDVYVAIRNYESSNEFSPKYFVVILSMAIAPFDNLNKKKPDKKAENQYGIDMKKQPSALKIIFWAIGATPTFTVEDRLKKILNLINKSVNGRIINDYLDIPKHLLFASTLVEYAENLPKKKKDPFNDYVAFKNSNPENRKAAYATFKLDAIKAMTALRAVQNFIDLTVYKLNISYGTDIEEAAKAQAAIKIKKFLYASIEILIWYKYFGPIIAIGNILGSLEVWGSLKQNAFVETCKLVDENVKLFNDLKKANDNYGWIIANEIKKYATKLNITDLSGHLDNNPICYEASELPKTPLNYLSPKQTPTYHSFINLPSNPLQEIRPNSPFLQSLKPRPSSINIQSDYLQQNKPIEPSKNPLLSSNPSLSSNDNQNRPAQPVETDKASTSIKDEDSDMSTSEIDEEELRRQEEFLSLGAENADNSSTDELNQFNTLQSHWSFIDDQIYKIISNECVGAKDLFTNMNTWIQNQNETKFKIGLIHLKEITKKCSQPINEFLKNNWTKKLDFTIFPKALINSALDGYNNSTFSSFVNFLNIISSKESKLYKPLRENFYSINDGLGLYVALGLNEEISVIDKRFKEYEQITLYEKSIYLPEFIESLQNDSKEGLQRFYNYYWDNNKKSLSNHYQNKINEIDNSKNEIVKEQDHFKMFLQIPNIKSIIDLKIKTSAIDSYKGLVTQ
ncbi:212_t:CDS:2 [Gigaspora margarita]|uniref:212_t:CDS:1 n=1 Tax=Gigaspora margarita TaxID=4874 RepID=A0ABN7UB58_GIGMA|nr:212_t:CDS:2 [Gigaspora margarita]